MSKTSLIFASPIARIVVFFPLAAAALAVLAFFALKPPAEDNFWVRVLIAKDKKELLISSNGPCNVYDAARGDILAQKVVFSAGTRISPAISGMMIGSLFMPSEKILVSAGRVGCVSIDGTEYRGEMYIVKDGARFSAVNKVRLEDYLRGVLPREVNRFWPVEALKAQAIASRSFAVHEVLRRRSRDYDLLADTFSQVYGGKSCERWRTTWAVETTKGKVLIYNNRVFPAYFHSCCGGHTEDAARLWGKGIKPLVGVKCPWCRWSPYFRWRANIPAEEMTAKLKSKARGISVVDDIKAGKRDDSGRLEYVEIRSGEHRNRMGTEDLRAVIGGGTLKSSNFRVRRYPDHFMFAGYGWGHGVGMCQWGAFTLALGWWSAEKILKYYYPGTRVGRLGNILG